MTTAARETESVAAAPPDIRRVDDLAAWDHRPERRKFARVLAGYVAVLGAVFLAFCWLVPLASTDLWGHLAYGRLLWERGVFPLPDTEPLMPFAAGVPFMDTAWLSQLGGYAAWLVGGLAGLRFLFAAGVTACLALLCWGMYARVRNWWLPLAGGALFLWIDWKQLEIVRPQLAGLVCFTALWVILTSRRWSRANWILVPAIFVLWANLHGSFPVGLGVLACFVVGRAIDVERRSHRPGAIVLDRQVQRYFFLLELAAAAVLLNPYGTRLYAEVFTFAAHPNLEGLSDWQPLTLQMTQGTAAGFAALVLVFLYRLTPRRITAAEVLVLVGLGIAAMWTSRMLVWWAPVAAWYAVLHGSAVLRRDRATRPRPVPSPRSIAWTLATLGLIAAIWIVSPLHRALVLGDQPDLRRSLAGGTPIDAVRYLRENPVSGQMFNTFEWGDYLLWAGPPRVRVYVNSHAHLVPRDIWVNYQDITNLRSGWGGALDFFGINGLLLDPLRDPSLVRELRNDADWQVAFERDDGLEQSIVFVRREPI